MSGERVKAKKKSAKKAAAASASVAKRTKKAVAPMTLRQAGKYVRPDFLIENVRCFSGRQCVPIRPITLLVGENSVGKTTFLGGYRVLSEILGNRFRSSGDDYSGAFNAPPFSMGGFRDIVKRPRTKLAKMGEFRLGWVGEEKKGVNAVLSVEFCFGSEEWTEAEEWAPFLSRVIITFCSGDKLEVARQKHSDNDGSSEISGPGFRFKINLPMTQMRFRSGRFFTFLMRDVQKNRKLRGPQVAQVDKFLIFISPKVKMEKAQKKVKGIILPGLSMHRRFVVDVEGGSSMVRTEQVTAIAPIRSKPKRTYTILGSDFDSEGGEIPALMSRLSRTNPKKWRDLQKRLIAFGKMSGMFSDFNVVDHGIDAGGDFHLQVKVRGSAPNIMDVGYGVSQAYPLLAQIMSASQRRMSATFLLQQPEVHLHPRAQAALASFFVNSVKKDGHAFLVETHSDFIVDRVCMHVAEGDIDPDDVALLFFEPQKTGGKVKIHRVKLNNSGEPVSVPQGYRDFFLHETKRALGLQKG